MKWAIAFVAVLASYPVGRWLRQHPAHRVRLWTLVGLIPFLAPHYMALISFGARPGDTQGFEVAAIDWLALCLLLAARPAPRPLPYRFEFALYFLVVLASIPHARWELHAAGYAWKLCRMYLMALAVWRSGCEDERVPAAVLRGMALGIVYEGILVGWQHFGLGLHPATGSFTHQNTLGMLTNLVVIVSIARILAGPTSWLTKSTLATAVAAVLFTSSRGALLFLGFGTALVYVGSLMRGITQRKTWFGVGALVLMAVLVPLSLSSIGSRKASEQAESMEMRGVLENAAAAMLRDHPLGVGANHYSAELLFDGYGEREGIGWFMRRAIVHNVYWLTLAELGYAGILALLILFLAPLRLAFTHGRWRRRGGRGDVLLGLGVALTATYIHSFFEWIWRLTEVSYLYFMCIALIAVLARQVRPRVRVAAGPALPLRDPEPCAASQRP